MALLRGEMPVYSTAMTAFVGKAVQDVGEADFDQRVCYFVPKKLARPTAWKQKACLAEEKTMELCPYPSRHRVPRDPGRTPDGMVRPVSWSPVFPECMAPTPGFRDGWGYWCVQRQARHR